MFFAYLGKDEGDPAARQPANWSQASSALAPYMKAGPPPIIIATPTVSATWARVAPALCAAWTWKPMQSVHC
jgi:hypothetical protein